MTQSNTAAQYQWLVRGRSNVQELCFDLYATVQSHRAVLEQDAGRRSVFSLLVGASFSLWRAIFLTADMRRDTTALMTNVEKFLELLVRDNTITYAQDRGTQEWSAGYYVNNARYRVARVREKLAPIAGAAGVSGSAAFQRFDELDRRGIDGQSTLMDEWDATYHAVREALTLLFPNP